MDSFEREARLSGHRFVAGVDEAGRGPLAGPVVAAAVIFKTPPLNLGIKDSKLLTPGARERIALDIHSYALSIGVGIVWPDAIDGMNIHRASLKAMEVAVNALAPLPDILLIDGPWTIDALSLAQRPIISGDSLSVTIGAASIIAKTTRDGIMRAYHTIYPEYNFVKNKGYPTGEHISVLEAIGPCPIHRKTFSFRRGRL
ncbi:MAG: ribonuclease HII [Deltaproteobacteria bacterium]|nr:ribonuclease HII [Deltaproteobacteria bacterium]